MRKSAVAIFRARSEMVRELSFCIVLCNMFIYKGLLCAKFIFYAPSFSIITWRIEYLAHRDKVGA